VAALDLGDDLVAEPDLLEASLGRDDQLRAAVARVGAALDVAGLLELVDDAPDDLLVPSREPGELGRADAVLVEVGEHRAVTRVKVPVPLLGEALVQLALERPLKARGEDSEIRVQLLPLAPSLGRRHDGLNSG
jgi:hypothetical protein